MTLPDIPRADQFLERESPAIEAAQRERAEIEWQIFRLFKIYEDTHGREALKNLVNGWPNV